jgi:hypothetical protein
MVLRDLTLIKKRKTHYISEYIYLCKLVQVWRKVEKATLEVVNTGYHDV